MVLEVKPEFRRGPASLNDIYVPGTGGVQVPLSSVATVTRAAGLARRSATSAQFPATTISFNLAPGYALGRGGGRDREAAEGARASRPASAPASRARRSPSAPRSRNTLLLILAAIVTMYIVLGVLYESYIHPVTILSTLPSAGVGALLSLMLVRPGPRDHRDHRHHPADRHREEERDPDDRLRARGRARAAAARRARRSTRPACCASARSS